MMKNSPKEAKKVGTFEGDFDIVLVGERKRKSVVSTQIFARG
jgi:hypothetical protein